ncbi:ABC transporter substrate-binding protein [Amycolatopsis regifaucium]|uniref:Sulfonate ABC transporter substrate-binding protein n=1 Tax=Amycolatopsis regifaucium TaxID=546365 RepID=A0A154MUK7_9PSEU|nr:ABC transporter substrate-binding protein [Amycolatopsis regifaucium]KZB87760.1 sulfonate ABC transporter substrate-binding protein [Amycolatopsis regifaucium]OKA08467.1 sulfonate ABC transporter substrate-binding protein [Amycolatopsis regifaucium]
MRVLAIPLVGALLALAGCGVFSHGDRTSDAPLERTELRVGVGSPIDTAPLRVAVAGGKFTAAGLSVTLVDTPADQAITELSAGEIDIAFASDVSIFRAAAAGTALQLQGEAYTAGRNTMALVTLPGSEYTEPTQKKSPKIAVNMLDDVGVLAARAVFGTAGVDVNRIQFKQHAFDRMPQALQSGDVDAAWMVEPYITRAEKELGASILADGARGATLDFPMSSYVSTGGFGQANARTLAAFRKVLGEAQIRAADPAIVRDALPTFSDIDRTTASLISLGTYPVSLNGIRLQRVADLMHNSGMIGARLDVQAMVPR